MFIGAFHSLFDGTLKMFELEATNELDALKETVIKASEGDEHVAQALSECTDAEQLKNMVLSWEDTVKVLQIKAG